MLKFETVNEVVTTVCETVAHIVGTSTKTTIDNGTLNINSILSGLYTELNFNHTLDVDYFNGDLIKVEILKAIGAIIIYRAVYENDKIIGFTIVNHVWIHDKDVATLACELTVELMNIKNKTK